MWWCEPLAGPIMTGVYDSHPTKIKPCSAPLNLGVLTGTGFVVMPNRIPINHQCQVIYDQHLMSLQRTRTAKHSINKQYYDAPSDYRNTNKHSTTNERRYCRCQNLHIRIGLRKRIRKVPEFPISFSTKGQNSRIVGGKNYIDDTIRCQIYEDRWSHNPFQRIWIDPLCL